ncbi:hypothetical protein G6F57_004342 [Rhizopus arrhizus]|nr:hypothetical protein G6F22_005885 [Rhizopus arrhizus]KAG1429163.1 hypothetical protein G6F58_000199 [Rhizopus delemar]KAG0792809.1 hypothetical protein G6F21_004088 [Rhizopus arrhizus]KAG0814202.1 hypothetical protein G6F20_004967 [Rhizopus arrhizus]KAG0833986.1 hypothetical protein G6F19_005440 [Rhizopus arrhizus]
MIEETKEPWTALMNHTNKQRMYPFRSRLVKLLNESRQAHLFFHLRIRHLAIDFLSSEANDKVSTIQSSVSSTIEILKHCPNIEQLDILYDASFSSFDSHLFSSSVAHLGRYIQCNNTCHIKRLDLVGYNPMQRCPCCAGKVWDAYLSPLLRSLHHLQVLVLQYVLPSSQVFEALAHSTQLVKIVFYKSIISLPVRREKQSNYIRSRRTTISQVPDALWKRVKSIEIYEDIDECASWHTHRYLLELAGHVGYGLESFVLHFGTKEENERRLGCLETEQKTCHHFNFSQTSPLLKLKTKCGESLRRISLVNVPEVLL